MGASHRDKAAEDRWPRGRAEWQQAADLAHACLALDAARLYGLVEGGPRIRPERCAAILDRARLRGIVPSPDAIERFLAAYQAESAGRP